MKMRLIALLFSQALTIQLLMCIAQPTNSQNSVVIIYNNNIPSGNPPTVLPNISGAPNNVVIIVPMDFRFDRNSVNIPGRELPLDVKEQKFLCNEVPRFGTHEKILETIEKNLNSQFIIGRAENDILTGKITKGCKMTAQISLGALKKWASGPQCLIPEPTFSTKVACAVGMALKNKAVNAAAERGIEGGCNYIIKNITRSIVEIGIEVKQEAVNLVEELKNFVGFMNTIDGAYWIMYQVQPPGPFE